MPFAPRDYQYDVTDRARARMRTSGRRGIIQGETRSGKTVVGCWLAFLARMNGKRTLVLADRRRLIRQFGSTLKEMGIPYGVIMAGETGGTRESIVLASRDTFTSWLANHKDFDPPDLIIPDECHRTPGNVYQAILAQYPQAYVVGLTATPSRDDGKSLGDFYGWIECTVPASKLVADGWLIKPTVYAPLELARKRRTGEGKGLAGDPVQHWLAHADGLPTIAFCSNLVEAKELAERFARAGIPSESISAQVADDPDPSGKSERDRVYDRLACGQISVLTSVGLLVEGVDIPEISAVIWWCPCGSVVKWRQGNGRAMRPCPRIGKDRAIVLDHAGAAGLHGLPGDDVQWSLDADSTVASRRAADLAANPDKRTIVCRQCGLAYAGQPSCPGCGARAPQPPASRKTMAESYAASTNAILERYDGEQQAVLVAEKRQRVWRNAIFAAVKRNSPAFVAAKIFHRTCRVWPEAAGVAPIPESWSVPAAVAFAAVVGGAAS